MGKIWICLLKRKTLGFILRNRVLLRRYWKGQWAFFQASLPKRWLKQLRRLQNNMTETISNCPGPSRLGWPDTPGPGLCSQTRHQSRWISLRTCNLVPKSLYYDYNPAIKSYGHSMRSQLTNEWESTFCLCVDLSHKTGHWPGLMFDSCPLPVPFDKPWMHNIHTRMK